MIKTSEETSYGWYSLNPKGNNKWSTHILGFVDDTRNFVTLHQSKGNDIVLCKMLQDSAQSWEHLLSTSGCNLNPWKCAVYIIRWIFQQDRTPKIDNVSHYNIPITSSIDETISNVRYLRPNEFLIYLGHISQPDSNQTHAFNIIIRTVETFARRIISSAMTRSQVTMPNNSIINPTIKYSLATTSFTDKIIDKLYKIIHLTVISGMGYSSRWPKELRYELHHHYSLKLQQYGLKKLLSKIVVIHKVANQNMIDSYQIASGITTAILEIQEWKVDYVNIVWTVHLIK